jgi:hypothetical protein
LDRAAKATYSTASQMSIDLRHASEFEIRQRLERVQRLIAALTLNVQQLEGERDRLLLRLTDLEGAHDRRYVPCR